MQLPRIQQQRHLVLVAALALLMVAAACQDQSNASGEPAPDETDNAQWSTVELPADLDIPDAGIYVDVQEARVSDAGVDIDYVIVRDEDVDALPIGQEVYLELPDGTVVDGDQRVAQGQSASEGGSILFPPLPDDADTFTIAFGDYLIAERGPVEVTFTLPQPVNVTEDRVEVDLDTEFTVAGEGMRVTQLVATAPTDENPEGSVEIQVQSDMPVDEASIRFIGPDTSGQILTDNLGNRFEAAGGSISFDPDGTSVVRFDTELDPSATELTLSTGFYGRVVEGREAITLTIEEAPTSSHVQGSKAIEPGDVAAAGKPAITEEDVQEYIEDYSIPHLAPEAPLPVVESIEFLTSEELADRLEDAPLRTPGTLLGLVTVRGEFAVYGPAGIVRRGDRSLLVFDAQTGNFLMQTVQYID